MTKILIVDDEPRILFLMKNLLMVNGFEVETAEDGPSALKIAKAGKVEIVISDLHMQPMDGLALLKEIKAFQPAMPVIILTSQPDVGTALAAKRGGVFDYMTKPFKVDEMIACLKRAQAMKTTHADKSPYAFLKAFLRREERRTVGELLEACSDEGESKFKSGLAEVYRRLGQDRMPQA